jgi:hypothetical protein
MIGGSVSEARALNNGSSWIRAGWGGWLRSDSGVHHPLLELALPVEAQMLPLAGAQRLSLGDGLTNLMECRYKLVGDAKGPQQRLERELWVSFFFQHSFFEIPLIGNSLLLHRSYEKNVVYFCLQI